MKAATLGLVVLAAATLGTSPALAKTKHHQASCSSIRAALSSGKTPQQVAKSLRATQDRVRSCSAMAQGSGAQSSAKSNPGQGTAK